MSRGINASGLTQHIAMKDATITTLRQQLAAAARECEAWRLPHGWELNGTNRRMKVKEAVAATDKIIPDLAAVAKEKA